MSTTDQGQAGHMSLLNTRPLAGYIDEIGTADITVITDYLNQDVRMLMLAELNTMQLTEAEHETGPFKIKQSYAYSTMFADGSLFKDVAEALQQELNKAAHSCSTAHFSELLQFNDMVVQRYPPTEVGISPHRDGLKYINLVAVFVLEGKGRFCMCDDREGSNPRTIQNEPGDLLLMRAPGFNSEPKQPFHFVDNIETQRTSFAMRQSRT